MSESPTVDEAPKESSVSTEIGRAVGSIWQRRDGTRPANVSTEFKGDSIRCTIERADEPAEAEAADVPAGGTDSNAYRHEAAAAVSRITKRTVSAYISKTDKKTELTTQTFILERNLPKH
jgi:hypothetical protein